MLSPEKAGLLSTFLGRLPGQIALRLAKAIEADQLAGGSAMPHDLILEALRPALRDAHTDQRTPTPLRLFCQPFADLLTLTVTKEKRKGRIARASVAPVWNWLSDTLAPVAVRDYRTAIKQAVLTNKPDDVRAHAISFWIAAAEALQTAIVADRKNARRVLGEEAIVADAEEMALLLAAGKDIIDLQDLLPRGTHTLPDAMVWTLRGIYDRIVQNVPDAAPYVAVITMGRIDKPWEALKLPLAISRQTSDTMISNTDMGLAGEVLFADLEVHSNAVRAVKHPNFDPRDLAAHVSMFSKLSNGLVQEVELRRDGAWHQRLMKDRTTVADTMTELMKRAPREIIAALPVHKTGSYGGGPKAPDVSKAPDAEKTDRGLRYAQLVALARSFAAAASFGAAQKDALNEVSIHLKSYSDDIVREVRSTDSAKRAIAELYFNVAADLTAILFSEEEAENYRRRGRAALATAA